MIGFSFTKGVVLCDQYFGTITGSKFAEIVDHSFPIAFSNSVNPEPRRIIMDGSSQNSAIGKKAIAAVDGIIMSIPARSPDLNPIENLFMQVDRKLKADAVALNITKESFEEFSQRCKYTLLNFDKRKIDALISSMPKRIKEVIRSKGQRINY